MIIGGAEDKLRRRRILKEFVASSGGPESRIDIATADAIRREVSDRLHAGSPNFWLTIDFTAERRWM